METNEKIIGTLAGLSAKLVAADAGDKDVIVEVGSVLEKTVGTLPDDNDCTDAKDLLARCLQTLQAVYLGQVSDAEDAFNAVAGALSAVADSLGEAADTEAVGQAAATLQQFASGLQEQTADEPAESAPCEPEPQTAAQKQSEAPSFDPPECLLPEDSDMELLGEFCIECLDHIGNAEASLLDIEANPEDVEPINVVFRAFHTIKGTSGFLGLDVIQKVAHLAENLLDRARDGEIRITGGYADLSLRSSDALKTMIEGMSDIAPGGQLVIPEDINDLLAVLHNPEGSGIGEDDVDEAMRVGDILVGQGAAKRKDVERAAEHQEGEPIGRVIVADGTAPATEVVKAIRTQQKIANAPKTKAAGESTVRVGTGRLDNLMNMVGELVIAQAMVSQDPTVHSGQSPRLTRNVSHAGKIIRELQNLAMSVRMVPLKATFQKMARLVRDLARKAGKKVRFVTEGEDTEIDRGMVEVLGDPLVHMIRNSCDHGIEPEEARQAAGKDPMGTITLRAYHSGGNVVIELEDDGKGLDRDKIVAKAVERGIVESGKDLTDAETFMLIFQAGFSMAEKVTDISGRGVGMDVVRRGIESVRGRIETASKLGTGTTFTMRLPLTMAITDAMLVSVGHEHYLLPTISIEQSFKPDPDAMSTVTDRGEVVKLRGDLLPIFRLHRLFNVPGAATSIDDGLLIAIESEGKRCALMVDGLLGQQQVVIKSLGSAMGNIPGVSGAAILGDGRVGLILDSSGILQLVNEQAEVGEPILAEA